MTIGTPALTLSAKEAAQQLGVSRGLIELWAKGGCPFLGGEKLIAFRNPYSRKGVRYDAAQLGAVQSARATAQQIKRNSFLSFGEAWKRFKFSQSALYGWHDKDCCYLNGVKLDGHQEMRPVAKENGLREIWVYSRYQLERIAEVQKREKSGIFEDDERTWLSANAANKVYGIWSASLGDWQTKTCPFLGRFILHKPIRRLKSSGRYLRRTVYLESDLAAIAAAQRLPAKLPMFQDAEGTWLFAGEVARRTGWNADGLRYYRKKRWSCLPDGLLRAKQISAENHPHYPHISFKKVWVYLEDHLMQIVGGRRGRRVDQPQVGPDEPAPVPTPQAEEIRTTSQRRSRVGRPKGSRGRKATQRRKELLQRWDDGEFKSTAEAARAFRIDRSTAWKILNDACRLC